jgi:gliding motility-associated-like protein
MDPTQDLDFTWSPTGSILTPSDSSTVLVAPESNTTYTVDIMNNTLGCMLTESVTVNVSLFDYTITPASILCLGDNLQLMVENLDTTDISYVWTPTEYIVEGGNTCCPVVSPPVDTSFCVTIINNTYECVTEDCVDIDVSWFDPEVLEVYADPDSVIVNFPVDLSTNQDPNLDFMWSGPGLDDDDLTNPEPTAIPDTDGDAMWCVTVTNADGCTIEGCVSSSVIDPFCDERDIYLPNVFTPNGDGFNDVLYLRGNYVEGMELHIYNRWGQQVFFSDDQSIGWDGTFDGERLAPDVFGFYLEVQCPNEESYTTKGSITLLR